MLLEFASSSSPIAQLADSDARFLLFTGKGGVGKTSVACAVAVAAAKSGKKVLIVSTDPASNLDDVLETPLGEHPRLVAGTSSLYAANVDPEMAAAEYREKMVGPYRGILPNATVANMEEQLSGACTVEIASFNEFARLAGDETVTAGYDKVIFDTAPTGHTLRLLTLPAAWTDFIAENSTGTSCLGPLAGLREYEALYASAVASLNDGQRTTLVLVSHPDVSSLKEAARTSAELAGAGIRNQCLIVNGVFRARARDDSIAIALERQGAAALSGLPSELADLPRAEIPLMARSPLGIDALRELGRNRERTLKEPQAPIADENTLPPVGGLTDLIDAIASEGSGVVMTMGKGGVGKTTIAAALAVGLARRGHPVHLSTTDPAAHVADVVDADAGLLTLGRISPEVEVARYRESVLAAAAPQLDAQSLAMLEEDLRSPCTEEIAIFRAFAREMERGREQIIILDTAPTGHTLLLLDASQSYHREVLRTGVAGVPPEVLELLPRLRDPDFTKIIIVTTAESTPVSEASRLQDDLTRAGIGVFAWVINQSFAYCTTTDPLLRNRAVNEVPHIAEVAGTLADRVSAVPWAPEPPAGLANLAALIERSDAAGLRDLSPVGATE